MKKIFLGCLLLLLIACGCAKKTQEAIVEVPITVETHKPTPVPEPTPVPKPTEDLTGKAINQLTGMYIDEKTASRRPVAVVINNIRKALPQSGISQADYYYEVLAEGDITRIIALFQDFNSEKIGPVRSTRHYFIDFALNHDAVFVHHGGSPQGYESIRGLKINNIDGMSDGTTFWRDSERMKQAGMYEHSSYTSAEKILATIERRQIRAEKYEDFVQGFDFYPIQAVPIDGVPCKKVIVEFSPNYTSVFEYDKASRLYKKFQGENNHIDEEDGEQLSVSNILVQLTDVYIIAGDTAGRREVKTVGSGDGYLITNGEYIPVKWSRESRTATTVWTDLQGRSLKINRGKTWHCVYDGQVIFACD